MVSQELEEGLRGVAVPVWRGHEVVAAVNVSLQTHRAPAEAIEKTVVPFLQDAAQQIGHDYGGRATAPSGTAPRATAPTTTAPSGAAAGGVR
jgi:IclR family transcriptional regulator, pca regulon regulatory protein